MWRSKKQSRRELHALSCSLTYVISARRCTIVLASQANLTFTFLIVFIEIRNSSAPPCQLLKE